MSSRIVIIDLDKPSSYKDLSKVIRKNGYGYNPTTQIVIPEEHIKAASRIKNKRKRKKLVSSIAKSSKCKRHVMSAEDLIWVNTIQEGTQRSKIVTSYAITVWCNGGKVSIITDSPETERILKSQEFPVNITTIN